MPTSRFSQSQPPRLGLLVAPVLAVGLLALCVTFSASERVVLASDHHQAPPPEDKTDGKTVFTRKDGLADNGVTALLRDDRVLWVGTRAGLSRYTIRGSDAGLNWETFTSEDGMAADAVSDLWQGNTDGLWVSHPDGQISVFNGNGWTTYENITQTLDQAYKQIIDADIESPFWSIEEGGRVWALAEDTVGYYVGAVWRPYGQDAGLPSGRLVAVWAGDGAWIATESGQIAYFDGVNWSTYPNVFQAVQSQYDRIAASGPTNGPLWVVDKDGAVWVRNAFNQRNPQPDVRRFAEGNWTSFSSTDGMPAGFVEELRMDEFGRIWTRHSSDANGQGGGLGLYLGDQSGQAARANSWLAITPAFSGNVTDFWPEGTGGVWIGSLYQPETSAVPVGGLTFFSLETWQRLPLTALEQATLSDIWLDESNDLWLGLADTASSGSSSGLWRYRAPQGTRPARWTQVEGLRADDVRDLWGDGQGGLWVATGGGINYIALKNRQVSSYTLPTAPDLLDGNGQDQVWALALGAGGGVWQWDGTAWASHTISDGLSGGAFSDMDVLTNEEVYLASDRGLDIWDGEAWKSFSALPGRHVKQVWEDSAGDVWVSSEITPGRPFNLSLKQGSTWKTILDEKDTQRMGAEPLAFLRDSRKVVWLGTPTGLFTLGPDQNAQWRGLGPVDGLPTGPVTALYEDANRTLWIAIGEEAYRTDHLPCSHGAAESHSGAIGRPESDSRLIGCGEWIRFAPEVGAVQRITAGPDGSVLFVGESGVASYRPYGHELHVESVTNLITDETLDVSAPAVLTMGRNAVRIDLATAAPMLTEDDLYYRYRLEGADEGWHLAPAYSLGGKRASVTYAGLPGGVYTFTAATRSAALDYSREVTVALYVLSRSPDLSLAQASVEGRPAERPGTLESRIGQPVQIRLASNDDQPGQLTYRYRIEGLGENWTETTSAEVSFTLSAAGTYTFVAMALDSEGQTSEQVGTQINVSDPKEVKSSLRLPVEAMAAGMGVLAALLIGSAIVLMVRRRRRESW